MDAWSKIAVIVRRREYTDAELKAILRGWRSLLDDDFMIPNQRDMIYSLLDRARQALKAKAAAGDTVILQEALRCMLHQKHFNTSALNQFFVDIRMPVHYVAKRNAPLQNGTFKSGYRKERKKKMKDDFDRLFISHAYKDHEVIDEFVELLEAIGLRRERIFYSSLAECGVKLGENIVDAIKRELSNQKVHVIFMLSQNYYDSVMCLNEMGAAWVLQHTYTSILLPGFSYSELKGVINTGTLGMKLDGEPAELRNRMIELRDQIQKEFGLAPMDERTWNRKLDKFLKCLERAK